MDINPIGIAVPFFLLLIGIEYIVLKRQKRTVRLNDAVTDISCGIGDQMLGVFLKWVALFPYVYVVENFALFQLSTGSVWVWLMGGLGVDFFYYWYHRSSHRINLGWATHVVHHQSEAYNLSVALRQPWFSITFSWIFYLPLALFGIPFEVYVTTFAFNLLYQFWIHTETIGKLGWFEKCFNTPSHHRVHHGTDPAYIDKNYAGILIIWDRIFGTFKEEDQTPLYGTLKPLRSWNPVWANLSPWIDLAKRSHHFQSWSDKVYVWLAPPEWTPNGAFDTKAAFNGPDRGYDRDDAKNHRAYLMVNLLIAALLVGIVLTFEQSIRVDIKIGACVLLMWTVIVWGQLFEGVKHVWFLEAGRIAAFCVFTSWVCLS